MRNQSTSPRRLVARAGVLLAVAAGLVAVYSCSLIVDTSSTQCQKNADCANVSGSYPICGDAGLCVTSGTSSSGGGSSSSGSPPSCAVDGGIDGGGCYNGGGASCPAATTNDQLLNQCTTGCYPFDDTTVHGLVNGMLPSLPTPPDGGL